MSWRELIKQGYSFEHVSERLYGDGDAPDSFMTAWRLHEQRRRNWMGDLDAMPEHL